MSKGNQDYRRAYESAATELESLLLEQDRIEKHILSLRKTMNVLSSLLQEAGDDMHWRDRAFASLERTIQGSLTDDILKILRARSPEPLTTSDVSNVSNK